jgi:GAF domain-containing protein
MARVTKSVSGLIVYGGSGPTRSHPIAAHQPRYRHKTKHLQTFAPLLWAVSCGVESAIQSGCLPRRDWGHSEYLMTQNNDQAMMEEIVLPEHLLPLGSVLGQGVSALDLCMVLAKIFRVQYTEVALLRLEGGLLRFVFPEYLRTTGAIPLSSKAVAAHTALSKKPEIFNNFARVKHASIFETIKPEDNEETAAPAPIQKLMSVPVMDRDSAVVGVIQISRKALDSKFAQDFSREDLHDLELVAGLLATAPALMAN